MEQYLLHPFPNGELVINHGWSRILLKMVPVCSEPLLEAEVRWAIPLLTKKPFAQRPKWLLGWERIRGDYSSITFAFSDPDWTITKSILTQLIAMFGREVRATEFVDCPPLVICGHCHLLGHPTGSQVCKVKRGQSRCARCGRSHTMEEHHSQCKKHKAHKLAGVCDCPLFCLNCRQNGHISTDHTCPRCRDFYVRKKRRHNGLAQPKPNHPPADEVTTQQSPATAAQLAMPPEDIPTNEEGTAPTTPDAMDL